MPEPVELPVGEAPARHAHIPLCRFSRYGVKHRLHLLGDVRPFNVHYDKASPLGETLPHEARNCYYCREPRRYELRIEGYAPVGLLDFELPWKWHPFIAVFTRATVYAKLPEAPMRGRLVDVVKRRTQRSSVTQVTILKRGWEPLAGWFDVLEHLKRVWYPEVDWPRLAVPAAFEWEPEPERSKEIVAEPGPTLTAEQLGQLADHCEAQGLANLAAKYRAQIDAAQIDALASAPVVESVLVNGVAVPPAAPSTGGAGERSRQPVTAADPEAAAERERRRAVQAKPAAELNAGEAVEFDRILDYVTAPSKNGTPRKGGAK